MAISDKERQRIAAVFSGACSRKRLCPVKDFMAGFSDKWSIYTILLLGLHQKMRFSELRVAISGISQRMLAVTLRSLQHDGIVARSAYPETHARVEYCLTKLGESLLKPLLQLANWTEENFTTIVKARKEFQKIS